MKFLITGATGFVGSHLYERFQQEGHIPYALVRNENKANEFGIHENIVKGSLSNLSWIKELPDDLDGVIHVAGIVHADNPKEFEKINTQATINLFKELQKTYEDREKAHSPFHFIFISSLAAGGPSKIGEKRRVEDSDLPLSQYGISKALAEKSIKELNKEFILTIVRPPMIIGPRDPAVLDIFKMVKSRFILGPGLNFLKKTYSFIFISDLIEIIYQLSITKKEGTFYSSHSDIITFENLINTIKEDMKIKRLFHFPVPHFLLKLVAKLTSFLPVSSRLTNDKVIELSQDSWCCSNKEIKEIGIIPSVNIEKAVHATRVDYEQRGWL
ncbi:MAG: NAD(P)-dependent oxidoreductase [Bdellovibrionota bacterium]|nr:NAD(P)-dependent oxidoreductase [Bdellovibrionota bacterium]